MTIEIATSILEFAEDDELTVEEVPDPEGRLLDYIETAPLRNRQRGLFAGLGIKAYAERTRGEDTLETAIKDFLCDLRHLCDAAGLDFAALDQSGHRSYLEEIGGEG